MLLSLKAITKVNSSDLKQLLLNHTNYNKIVFSIPIKDDVCPIKLLFS